MQLSLPIFPESTVLVNHQFGIKREGDFVYYMLNGKTIYCHEKDDHDTYRFTLACIIKNELCTKAELSKALGINRKNLDRYCNAYKEKGADCFFNREDNRGQCYRFTEDKHTTAQELLNSGLLPAQVAKRIGVSESAIRYHLKSGDLKKNLMQTTASKSKPVNRVKGIG
jgi:hypothetical protein